MVESYWKDRVSRRLEDMTRKAREKEEASWQARVLEGLRRVAEIMLRFKQELKEVPLEIAVEHDGRAHMEVRYGELKSASISFRYQRIPQEALIFEECFPAESKIQPDQQNSLRCRPPDLNETWVRAKLEGLVDRYLDFAEKGMGRAR